MLLFVWWHINYCRFLIANLVYTCTHTHTHTHIYYRKAEKLSWCPSWSNSEWQRWSCGLVHCIGGNATDPIWRVLASSDRTPLKPQHSPNLNTFANQLWHIDFLNPPTPLITPHRLPAFLESFMSLKTTDAWFMQDGPKAFWIIPYVSVAFFPSLNQNFIAYRSSKDFIFKIHQLRQSGCISIPALAVHLNLKS